ncbi:MAG: tetratricopeptide repeat protein [Myxococcota bacterium]|nr:tetratricopeptide repeat protein [Myxococcota bacterium]
MSRRRLPCRAFVAGLVLVVAIASSGPTVASAQSAAEMGEARSLFEQGLAAARESRWEDARGSFERSLAIVERASILLNLAGAQAQTGRLVDAAASYRRFLEIARGRDARHRGDAETALRAVEARIPQVTLELEGLAAGDDVRIDDAPITADALAAAIALDPGSHVVVVTRGDQEAARAPFELEPGEQRTLAVIVRDTRPAETPVVAALAPAAPIEDDAPSDDGSVWIWVGVGIGVAVAAAVGIGVAASSSGEPTYYMGNLGDGMVRF